MATVTRLTPRLPEWCPSLRTGARALAVRPGASLAAVLCLALGISSSAVLLSVVDTVLLRPLPYPDPDRIAMVWEAPPNTLHNPVSGPNFHDWKRQSRSFAALAAVSVQAFNLSGGSEPEQVHGARVSAGFFEVFGTPPALGRVPRLDESTARVAVVSDRLWRQRLAASPGVLGSEIRVDGETHVVIGVLPPGREPQTMWALGSRMDIWVPFEPPSAPEHRSWHSMEVVGRLAEGVSLEQAQAEMTLIARGLEARYPDSNHDYGARVSRLHDELVGRGRTPLVLLLTAALMVLVLACANVAGIELARTSARSAELALRASLGAGNRRIALQLLIESIPLVLVSGLLGLAVTAWALDTLHSLLPSHSWQVRDLVVDGRVIAFCLGLTALAWALVGAPSALLAPRGDVAGRLRSSRGRSGGAPQHRRFRCTLVVAQLAIGLVLANSAVLLLESFHRLLDTDQGFDQEHVLSARLQLVGPRYESEGRVVEFLRELTPRLESLPGVRAAALTTKLPLFGGNNGTEVIEGRESDFGKDGGPEVERSTVSPSYFRVMDVPLVEGRLLTDSDAEAPVAVINQTFARVGWPGQSPLGKRFRSDTRWFTVVGVVGDVRQWGPERPARPELYRLFSAAPRYESEGYLMARPYVLLRTAGEPLDAASALTRAVHALDPDQPISDLSTMRQRVERANANRRFLTTLLTGLAGIALLLVATGQHGLMATVVVERTHELGVRMALGARCGQVLGLVLRQGLLLAVAGAVVGGVAALALTRVMRGVLYDVVPADPVTLAVASLLMIAAGVSASLAPAWRAARIQPVQALRHE